jgi:MFS family permease
MNDQPRPQEDFVEAHLKRNILVQLGHGMLGQTGFRLIVAPTFMPAYLFALSGSEFFVGLARSLQAVGQVLTPMLGASLIGHRRRMLRVTLISGGLMRLQILLLALSGLFLGASRLTPYAVVVFLTLMGFFQGIQGVTMNSLRAKVIPVHRRGFVSGWRNFLSGMTTALVSYFAGSYLIDNEVLGDGYSALFLVAFVITTTGLVCLAFTAEPAAEEVLERRNVRQSFQSMPALLRDNPNFARFFVVSALGAFGRMAMPFYVLYAGTRMEVSGAMLGVLTTVWMLTSTVANLFWGNVADRHGFRIVMIATLILWSLAHLELLRAVSVPGLVLFFVVVGTATGGFVQARQNLVLELGAEADIPMRVAVSNMAVSFIGTIGPLLGGLVATLFGYPAVFIACIVLQTAAAVILIGWVVEPRGVPVNVPLDDEGEDDQP